MKPLTDTQKQRLVKAIKYLALAIATSIAMALGLTSCNVTRTITTESKSLTQGDTAIIIQVKTIEPTTPADGAVTTVYDKFFLALVNAA